MHPETQLAIMAAFAGFLLKTSLGFGICWAIGKVVASPRRKFLVWLGFLVGAGCYWLWLVASFVPHGSPLISLPVPAALAASAPVGKWQMPPSWAFPLWIVLRVVAALYLIVLGHFLLARIKKQMRLRWVMRFAYRAPDLIERIFQPVAERLGAAKVRLLVLSGIYSPATFGWVHPVILLPPLCLEQDESELADIFRHELQHIRRWDFFSNSIASLCCALLFFHPAVWFALRRLELESELACDLAVVRDSPERRATYAECLVRFARLHAAQEPTPWNLDFAGSSVQLKVRVRSVLAETRKIPGWLLGLRAGLGLLLFAGFLCMAPSLFIVLSYANRIAEPIIPSVFHPQTKVRLRKSGISRAQTRENAALARRALEALTLAAPPAGQAELSAETAPTVPQEPNMLLSGKPVPTLKQRSDAPEAASSKPAHATVVLISDPSPSPAGHPIITKGRSFASAVMTGAGEAARFAVGHGREVH